MICSRPLLALWFMPSLAQRLKELRTPRNLMRTPRAELFDTSPRVYTRWETGDVTPQFVGLADTLGVSLDEVAGRMVVTSEIAIRNPELNRLYRKVDQLSYEDQKALVIVLDSLVKRSRVSRVMAEFQLPEETWNPI